MRYPDGRERTQRSRSARVRGTIKNVPTTLKTSVPESMHSDNSDTAEGTPSAVFSIGIVGLSFYCPNCTVYASVSHSPAIKSRVRISTRSAYTSSMTPLPPSLYCADGRFRQ